MIAETKKAIQINLKKASGTISKIEKMLDEGIYCAKVAQQVNAAIGLLKSVNNQLLENHIKSCGARKLLSNDKKYFVSSKILIKL